MSGICGWSSPGHDPRSNRSLLDRMSALLTRFDGSTAKAHLADRCAVACAARHAGADLHSDNDLVVAVAGTTRWSNGADAERPASVLARSFLEHGVQCLQTLRGGFAL